MNRREAALARFQKEPLDLLVVGGGIVGAGVARDAAMRGLRVGLIDQADFASGTSSRSSRLLHGGIRYLSQGRVGLVREASVEKTILHAIAPHLARSLAFVFPTYRGSGWPLWQLRVGVAIYDLLCGGRNLGKSRGLDRRETLDTLPGLKATGLNGAVRYFDGFTHDARLVLDTLRSAERSGAVLANYLRLETVQRHGDGWNGQVSDRLNGNSFAIRARTLVNATGPWADRWAQSSVRLRLTKGVHLVFEREKLRFPDAVVITEGKRILFVIPWGERVIVGTTDTDYDGNPEAVRCEAADVAYLLAALHRFFPEARLTARDIVSSWAGVRPLLADPNGNPSDLSRTHEIRNPRPGWWDIAGGKLTTYRLMAQQLLDRIVKTEGYRAAPCRTASTPLLPPGETVADGTLPPPFSRESVLRLCREEWVAHLDDLMIRRTGWQHYHRDTADLARRALDWMGEALGWDEAGKQDELARYLQHPDTP
ncbi:MAG TPA: glycerol-3-phosphate dehydrogenase/oxidase [Chthoniobacteraceae bacterium]|nr:glycerol-3-phosphate dehydrogenase/oxidase [Chthoniobacteraceae bacterium]